jgi:hypothetical protein
VADGVRMKVTNGKIEKSSHGIYGVKLTTVN